MSDDFTMMEWALAYAERGWAVLPVWWAIEDPDVAPDAEAPVMRCACDKGRDCPRPAKHPIPTQGVKQATTDPERVRAWWTEHPDANIAVATGTRSGCIVIDVDTGGDKAGDVALTTACAPHGGVPRTLKAHSGSGGRHYWYRMRPNPYTRKIGFLRAVDYLADGGYVIVQPSRNLKGVYLWDAELRITTPAKLAALRDELAELPAWFDALEGTGRAGRARPAGESGRRARASDDERARLVNAAAMEFVATDPRWVEEVGRALQHCDPDSRDDWVLFGIILGREFARGDDGWHLYEEWSARSVKYNDPGTPPAMRGYYYEDSQHEPQNGRAATIATIFARASENGYALPRNGLDARRVVAYRPGRAVETIGTLLTLLARERESEADRALRIYAFGSGLGSIIETHDTGARYTTEGRPPGGWVLRVTPHTAMSLGSRITHTATMVRFGTTGAAQQIECPAEISTLLLKDYGKNFPRLNGIVQWPMVINGKLAGVDDDYDPVAGLVFAMPDSDKINVSAAPTTDEARRAWLWLHDVALAGFPFDTERDAAAALAMLLTFQQRRAMETAPAFLITAPKIGTGKTTLARFASLAVHGRTLGAGPLSADSEEQRKAITAALLSNPPALLFDNLPAGGSFNSNELAIAMTSGEWEDRRLGSTERLTLPNRAVWVFTGNNVSPRSDLRRRFCTIRLVGKAVAHHEQVFKRNIERWPAEHRGEVLTALTTILLWAAREAPPLERESGYPQWDAEVRRAVVGITGHDPFASLEETDGEDEDEGAAVAIMKCWATEIGAAASKVQDWVALVATGAKSSDSARRSRAEAAVGAVAILRGLPATKLEARDYGYAFRTLKDRLVAMGGGLQCAFRTAGQRDKVALWQLEGCAALLTEMEKEF